MYTWIHLENANEGDEIKPYSDIVLHISQNIGHEWKRLARNLNIHDAEIDIAEDKELSSLPDKWRENFKVLRKKTKITWDIIKEAFCETGNCKIIGEYEEKLGITHCNTHTRSHTKQVWIMQVI